MERFFAGDAMMREPGSPVPMLMLLGCLMFGGLVRLLVLWLAGRTAHKKICLAAAYAAILIGVIASIAAMVLYWTERLEWSDIRLDFDYAIMMFLGAGFLGLFGGSVFLLHARPAGGKPQKRIRRMEALAAMALGVGGMISMAILRSYEGSTGLFICVGLMFSGVIFLAMEIAVNLIRCMKTQTKIHKIAVYAARAVGVGVIITTAVMILIEPATAFFILIGFVYGALAFLAIEIVLTLMRGILGIVKWLQTKNKTQ